MNQKSIEAGIQDFLADKEIPIFGISKIRQLPQVPEDDFSPKAILGDAKSVVCYGMPIPKGIIHADRDDLLLYWRYSILTYRTLDAIANQLCVALEKKGHRACPIYSCYPWKVVGREFRGLLPLVYWAQRTGLGKLTKCGLLANPDHGTGMLLGGVVTTAVLTPTEMAHEEPCPPECFDCIDICPVQAIGKTGKVDHELCMRHSGANPLLEHLVRDRALKEKYSFETILNAADVDDHGTYTCFKCLKACPLNK